MVETNNFARFESMGVAKVRDFAVQWQGALQHDAYKWLKLRDEELQLVSDSAAARAAAAAERAAEAAEEQSRAAIRAADAAENANKRATAALIIATISAIASIVGIYLSHQDASKSTASELTPPKMPSKP